MVRAVSINVVNTGKRACAEGVSEQLAVEASDRVVGPIARRLKAELSSAVEIGHLNLDLSGLRNNLLLLKSLGTQ